jgi:hypothetical protein
MLILAEIGVEPTRKLTAQWAIIRHSKAKRKRSASWGDSRIERIRDFADWGILP